MPKRTAAESFIHFSALILALTPKRQKKQVEKIFKEWEEEINEGGGISQEEKRVGKKTKRQLMSRAKFNAILKPFFVPVKTIDNFILNYEDFTNETNCMNHIKKLFEQDRADKQRLLKSAAFQGYGYDKLLEFCGNSKKLFATKIKQFELPHSLSYSYFLIRLSKLILPNPILLQSSLSVYFVKKYIKELERYAGRTPEGECEEDIATFGSQVNPMDISPSVSQ